MLRCAAEAEGNIPTIPTSNIVHAIHGTHKNKWVERGWLQKVWLVSSRHCPERIAKTNRKLIRFLGGIKRILTIHTYMFRIRSNRPCEGC